MFSTAVDIHVCTSTKHYILLPPNSQWGNGVDKEISFDVFTISRIFWYRSSSTSSACYCCFNYFFHNTSDTFVYLPTVVLSACSQQVWLFPDPENIVTKFTLFFIIGDVWVLIYLTLHLSFKTATHNYTMIVMLTTIFGIIVVLSI